jgi:hypothetical protein
MAWKITARTTRDTVKDIAIAVSSGRNSRLGRGLRQEEGDNLYQMEEEEDCPAGGWRMPC